MSIFGDDGFDEEAYERIRKMLSKEVEAHLDQYAATGFSCGGRKELLGWIIGALAPWNNRGIHDRANALINSHDQKVVSNE